MERRKALIILIVIMFFSAPTTTYAKDDLLPGEPIQSPLYEKYDTSDYELDFVPPTDTSISENIKIGIIEFLTMLLNLMWDLYLFLVELTIRIVNWVYDPNNFDQLFRMVGSLMSDVKSGVWDKLWYPVTGIGIFAIILIWIYGQTQRALTSILSIVVIIAFTPTLLLGIAKGLIYANSLVTVMSGQVMTQLVSIETEWATFVSSETKEPSVQNKDSKILVDGRDGPGFYMDAALYQMMTEVKKGIHAVDDGIWKSLAIHPYWIANFGNTNSGETNWNGLMKEGDSESKREKWLRNNGEIQSDGTAKKNAYEIFTVEGIGERFYKTIVVTIFGVIPLSIVLAFGAIVLVWKARAIGRTLFLPVDCIMALYPGYGIGTAIQAIVKVFSSFVMSLFYAIALAIFLAFWMKIQDPQMLPTASFGDRILIVIVILIGMWAGVQGVVSRLTNLPTLSGGTVNVNEGQSEFGAFRGALAMSTLNGQLTKPIGSAFRLGKKPIQFAGKKGVTGAKWTGKKVGKHSKEYLRNIDSVQKAKQKAKSWVPFKRKLQKLQPKQAQLSPNLSKQAAFAYTDMVKNRLDPTLSADRKDYLAKNPHQDTHVDEMEKWLKKDPYYQINETPRFDGSVVPAAPPPKSSPAYHTWKSSPTLQASWNVYRQAKANIDQQSTKKYNMKKQKYDNSRLRQFFQKRPVLENPSKWSYLKEYRRLIHANKKQNKGGF